MRTAIRFALFTLVLVGLSAAPTFGPSTQPQQITEGPGGCPTGFPVCG